MPKVTTIKAGQPLPPNGNCVEIIPAGDHFMANGSVAYIEPKPHMVTFNPPVFQTLEEAIAESIVWAEHHRVADVFVREN